MPLAYRDLSNLMRNISSSNAQPLRLSGERYLGTSRDLSTQSSAPLALVLLKSLRVPEREIRDINRLLLAVGCGIVLLGSVAVLENRRFPVSIYKRACGRWVCSS